MGRKPKPKLKAEETDATSNGHADCVTAVSSRRVPKRTTACVDYKEKSLRVSEKDHMVEAKKVRVVEDEMSAISLTEGHDVPRPNRRLLDFIFHDVNWKPQPVEMLEVTDLFITGLVLPFEPSTDKGKEQGVKCEGFGRIETWDISGYEDGSPVVWISTDVADYDCIKPAASYKKQYGRFHEKARACIEVYKRLSPSAGGDPDSSLEELLAYLVRTLSGSKCFPQVSSIRDFIISQGEFIYSQLTSLDETSTKNNHKFSQLPVLAALRDESRKSGAYFSQETLNACAPLKIGDMEIKKSSSPESGASKEDEDKKLAQLLQEEEYWHSVKDKRNRRGGGAKSKEFYIKINEDEIANDYPMPAFYKSSLDEADEYVIFDYAMDISNADLLPRSMLHDWSLYNSDSRLMSLELLPMKPCDDIDVTIYGSGKVTCDDGGGFCPDTEPSQSSLSSTGLEDGIPIYLSAIKEWMIEFGANMIFISIRTDMAWYRLGKPSKQYAPWYETVLKTAEVGIAIITLLKEQVRVARLSFPDVIKKVTELKEDHPAFISSDPKVVERYVIVHGQIILQQFAEYPDNAIRKCAFFSGLEEKMELMHHTKWLVKKKAVTKKGPNMNPRAKLGPAALTKKSMPATTTRLINRIWGEFYSHYSPEEPKNGVAGDIKEEDDAEEDEEEEEVEEDNEEVEDQKGSFVQETDKYIPDTRQKRLNGSHLDLKWRGELVGKTCRSEDLYKQANVHGNPVSVGGCVLVETIGAGDNPPIYYVEYMFEKKDGRKMFHGRLMLRGSETVLQNAATEREVFFTNQCADFELELVIQTVIVEIRLRPWGHQHRKGNADMDKMDRERAEDRKTKGLPLEYYCKSLYSPDEGAFFRLPSHSGRGNGICTSCKLREAQSEKESFELNPSNTGFLHKGIEYKLQDYVYIAPNHHSVVESSNSTVKGARNVGLKPYIICRLLEILGPEDSRQASPENTRIKLRRFYRPEDISSEKAYRSDIREVYYSETIFSLRVTAVEGKCEVRKKHELPFSGSLVIFDHIFFCEHVYNPNSQALKQLPPSVKLSFGRDGSVDDAIRRMNKGKGKEGEDEGTAEQKDDSPKNRLSTLDIFAGCGGLSEGLEQAGISTTKWAIEYEEPAGEAFRLNHPNTLMFIDNCNVILRAIMSACGDQTDCISTVEAIEGAAKLDERLINDLPRPGQVDFINGGPPCQGFSGMNRFNQSAWSKVQCEMILSFLSFADYFRPRYFLLENVRNFVSFNKGQTFRLALASLLEMGYQVRFGILEAGAFGVSQSRKRAFIWAASPEETLPEWPEPMHVFAGPELKISLDSSSKVQYAAVESTASGAPFRSITVRDSIGDLPAVGNGASMDSMEYKGEPISWFQKMIRGDMMVLTDHISKEMNELNCIRCQKIPKRSGADWRTLPDEKVRLSTGQVVDLVPWCLPNTAKRHNQWKGLYGRLSWEGNFPTSITDPQPMGKVGMCFHPDQDRIVTVRECARSQGFRDSYKFTGHIQHKHRQIGNAVPPPLAYALGRKLKEAVGKTT